jgi:hypothetical protein
MPTPNLLNVKIMLYDHFEEVLLHTLDWEEPMVPGLDDHVVHGGFLYRIYKRTFFKPNKLVLTAYQRSPVREVKNA